MAGGDGRTAGRLARTVAARLPAALDDADLAHRLCALGAAWLQIEPGRTRTDAAGRLRLPTTVSEELERLCRTVLWMRHPRYHHGQQAAKEAAKTLRALRADRLDCDALLAHAARFRALRQGHVRRNARDKAHAEAEVVPLLGGNYLATRVVSRRGLHQLGQQAGNCLANPNHARRYAARLRQNESEFWRIDWMDAKSPRLVWAIGLSTGTNTLEDVTRMRDPDGTMADRDALLEFLAGLGRCTGDGRAGSHAISRPVVAAARAGTLHRFGVTLAGAAWRFEAGPGVLVALPRDGDACLGGDAVSALVLHGLETSEAIVLSIVQGWRDAEDAWQCMEFDPGGVSTAHYRRDQAIRLLLREACTRSWRLRRACAEAFAAESDEFRADWFGTALHGPRP